MIDDITEARFWAKVDKSGPCWLWTASKSPAGYGKFSVRGRLVTAHRLAYELLVGPISDGLCLDHLCRNRACVRPDHLEPVTNAENIRRGLMGDAATNPTAVRRRAITHCPQGHPYDEANTYLLGGRRTCRTCKRARTRDRMARTRAAKKERAAR